VDDRLPEEGYPVILIIQNYKEENWGVGISCVLSGKWNSTSGEKATYWMYIPNPPNVTYYYDPAGTEIILDDPEVE